MFFKLFGWRFVFGDLKPSILLFTIDRLLLALFAGSVLILCNYWNGQSSNSIPKKPNKIWIAIDNVGLSLYVVHSAVIIASTVIQKQAQTFDMVHIVSTNLTKSIVDLKCSTCTLFLSSTSITSVISCYHLSVPFCFIFLLKYRSENSSRSCSWKDLYIQKLLSENWMFLKFKNSINIADFI